MTILAPIGRDLDVVWGDPSKIHQNWRRPALSRRPMTETIKGTEEQLIADLSRREAMAAQGPLRPVLTYRFDNLAS